jgi:hypothetical protein
MSINEVGHDNAAHRRPHPIIDPSHTAVRDMRNTLLRNRRTRYHL